MATTQPSQALRKAIGVIGSQSALAALLGITQGAISRWLARGSSLPAEHVLKVEAATGISRHDLRPDLYPRETEAPADRAGQRDELQGFAA